MGPRPATESDRKALLFAMNLSLAVGCLMFFLKMGAYLLTGSSAILSDAAESVVHVAAVVFAWWSLRMSFRPPDRNHPYGHAKISFFSVGFEGGMIILAGLYIIAESVRKWIAGLELENLGAGTLLTAAAVLINGALGGYLVWLGRKRDSRILAGNGQHVLTDCWTSIAVLVGLGLVMVTGWLPFDPICGILMALNILRSGFELVRSAFSGLMDEADPEVERTLAGILDGETRRRGLAYHNLRHRSLGDAVAVEFHLVFPDGETLASAHAAATEIERVLGGALRPQAYFTTHLENVSDQKDDHP
jgi:cation diffusion facilitator family transporter